jgi:hypothetical protein
MYYLCVQLLLQQLLCGLAFPFYLQKVFKTGIHPLCPVYCDFKTIVSHADTGVHTVTDLEQQHVIVELHIQQL